MSDWSRPRSTMAVHPIDSLQDGHDKWITGMTNYKPKVHPSELGMLAHFMPVVEFKNSPMN